MSYAGTGNEKATSAGSLSRGHIGQTVGFETDDGVLVFGRIAAIARRQDSTTIALEGASDQGDLKSAYVLNGAQTVYLQPDVLANTETTIKDLFGKVQDNLRATKGGGQPWGTPRRTGPDAGMGSGTDPM